jgi:hypothetical protein
MKTKNQMKERTAFAVPPKQRVGISQDSFLQANRFLVGENIDAPRGGACEGQDTSIFFTQQIDGRFTKYQLEARNKAVAMCRSCNIRAKCLMYSLEYEPHGIWGGFPERIRALLGSFWKIQNKRPWGVRNSFLRYRSLLDYIIHPEDIAFIKKVAHDNNLASPPFDERKGLSATARRRISQGLADPIS